jgi:hypothetical protein
LIVADIFEALSEMRHAADYGLCGWLLRVFRGPQWIYEQVYCRRGDIGVSREGHINQSVKVRPRLRDSSLVAGEASWTKSETMKPSDNILRKEYEQPTRLQRAVNADVAS